MKKHAAAVLLLILSVVMIPAVPACISGKTDSSAEDAEQTEEYTTAPEKADKQPVFSAEPYKVLDIVSGKVLEVPVRDYVIGAVCAEMPANFGIEALKAQAVAAHTYAERRRISAESSPDGELKGADFSNDTSKYQGYFTKERAKECFGERFEENYAKISAAVDDVLPYIITYENAPIIAAFHSMSGGYTESAENVWGAPVDYLVEVDSRSDMTAPHFREKTAFSREELKAALEAAFPDVKLGGDMKEWLKVLTVSDSGTVLTAAVGDMTVSGGDIRDALGLRSASFEVSVCGNEAEITTKGFGHGVGMSQYGANAMAADGKSWREILGHYYPNCIISGN
ncbi:MAG: stage II sporulation protein D [Ruminococcus sp.]|uniref:stage II sporulation protein D n=1 Tax=Ruminococcus sp. TaxID=41978 RepID=UPI0025FC514C|nr:stage II sporulation protein D [Ruminococcus sp.]MBR5682025.1 stage II sporulation protein D [Ruminococcus sp.]